MNSPNDHPMICHGNNNWSISGEYCAEIYKGAQSRPATQGGRALLTLGDRGTSLANIEYKLVIGLRFA